jgi:hypothetical protein
MIKKIVLILITLPFSILGQEESVDNSVVPGSGQYRWEIGINGGVNITNVSGLIPDSSNSKIENNIGRLYGATVVYHMNKFFAIKTDIDFESKGWTITNTEVVTDPVTGVSSKEDIIQNLNYFDIPAFLHVGFGNKLKFDFNFGPYFAFLLEDQASYKNAAGEMIPVTRDDLTGFSSTDFGITYGAGIDLALGKRFSFGFDCLYEQGLKSIKEGGVKNTSLDFDFGINFLFGEKK